MLMLTFLNQIYYYPVVIIWRSRPNLIRIFLQVEVPKVKSLTSLLEIKHINHSVIEIVLLIEISFLSIYPEYNCSRHLEWQPR
jgi:hypothetical protein